MLGGQKIIHKKIYHIQYLTFKTEKPIYFIFKVHILLIYKERYISITLL